MEKEEEENQIPIIHQYHHGTDHLTGGVGRHHVPIKPNNLNQNNHNTNNQQNENNNYKEKTQCPRCNQFVCRDSQSLMVHKRLCNGSTICCRDCYLIFLTRNELVQHKKKCKIYLKNQRLKRKSDKKSQIDGRNENIKNINNTFICTFTECNKLFKSQKTLRQHIKRHNKPYQCNYNGCTKSFGSSWDRKIHGMSNMKKKILLYFSRNFRVNFNGLLFYFVTDYE